MPDETSLMNWAGGRRVTLAIVFTDVVQGAQLGTTLGDDRMNEIKENHYDLALLKIAEHEGRFIKTIGDAVMAVFKATSQAANFARTFCASPGAPELGGRVRAGVHIGEVYVKDADSTPPDVSGSEVDFAARVVGTIKGAEVWISDQAMIALRRRLGAAHPDLASWEQKSNIVFRGFEDERPVTLWSLSSSASTSQAVTRDAEGRQREVAEQSHKVDNVAPVGSRAQNYDRVDFVSSAEVLIDELAEGSDRGIYAQADFVERLYVESPQARVEFGVRRAFIVIDNDGPGSITRADALRGPPGHRNARFVTLHEAMEAIAVCIDPEEGRSSLAELALPPTPRENYFCQIANATDNVIADKLRAELQVSLDAEGIYLSDEVIGKISPSNKKKISAIMGVAAKKDYYKLESGLIRRPLKISGRKR